MIIHKCDICDKEQSAKLVLAGLRLEDNKIIKDGTETCAECDEIGEVAKEEALKKRKKKV